MVHRIDMGDLRDALGQELPGEAAKESFLPRPRRQWSYPGRIRRASVLALLLRYDEDLRLPLIRRRVIEGDAHSGQISLPGGQEERGESASETALRECEEELGIRSQSVELLGRLSTHRIPVSGYEVTPLVGTVAAPIGYWRDPQEVDAVFEVSLRTLLDRQARSEVDMSLRGRLYRVPGWQLPEGFLWGATAMILGELVELLRPLLQRL